MGKNLIDLYTDYLISSFSSTTATGLSTLVDGSLSHDQITTFLAESDLDSKSLWLNVKPMVRELEKAKGTGVLIFDDSIAQKPYSDENEIVCYHWDHAKQRHVKGINFLNCLFQKDGISLPISAEIIEKNEYFIDQKTGKKKRRSSITKNELMQKMLTVAQNNRVLYDYVLADSWFSSADNMKFIKKNLQKEFVFALKSNRLVALSLEDKLEGKFVPIDSLPLNEDTLISVYIKGLDFPVSLVKQSFTNKDDSEGELYLACSDSPCDYSQITTIYQKRWSVEEFHKSLKQNASLEKSPTHVKKTQKNHFFASIYAFVKLEQLKIKNSMNHFAIKTRLYINALRASMKELHSMREALAWKITLGKYYARNMS